MKILLADEDKTTLFKLTKYLNNVGKGCHEIVQAISGADLLNKTKTEKFDWIICDYYLGASPNGLTILKDLRNSGDQTRFIIYTGASCFNLLAQEARALNAIAIDTLFEELPTQISKYIKVPTCLQTRKLEL